MSKKRKRRPSSTSAKTARRSAERTEPGAPSPAKPPSTRFGTGRSPWLVGLAVLIGLTVILSECLVVQRNAVAPARQKSASVKPLGAAAGAPDASARQPDYYLDFDGYYWVSYARRMISEGEFRVRRTDLDNAPFGREVHWSSVFSWWLVVLGSCHAALSGLSIEMAIGAAAYPANPILMGLLLVGVGWASLWRIGSLGGALMVVLLALQPALLRDFGYGRPDHHGVHLICALGVVLTALLGGGGWVLRRDGAHEVRRSRVDPTGGGFLLGYAGARRWFIASGIFGGFGLWIGATQQALVIGAVGLGALIATMVAAREESAATGGKPSTDDRPVWSPELWRVWSRVGALTGFLAYLVESFPGDMGMRLEVNHPLYAVAWLCAGEILYLIGKQRQVGAAWAGMALLKLGLLAGGVALLPVLVFLGPASWYLPRDPLMLRLHSVIGEFRPLLSEIQGTGGLAGELAPAGLIAVGIWVLITNRANAPERTLLIVSLVPALCLGLMFFLQVRWSGLFVIASCGVVVPLVLLAARDLGRFTRSVAVAMLLVSAVGLQLVPNAARVISRAGVAPGEASAIPLADEVFARDVALILGAINDGGPEPISVMAGLGEGSRIHAFGPARAVGSQYWENLDGVRDTVDFFADDGEEDALRIVRKRDIGYIVVSTDMASMAHMLKHGTNDPEAVEKTLAYRLLSQRSGVPSWCRPLRVRGFRWTDRCRIYKVEGLGGRGR